MEFKQFRILMQKHLEEMFQNNNKLFITETDKDLMWETYLNSFPSGTNEIFRKRREFDCSCCRHFVKSFGNVVIINENNEVVSIWDFEVDDPKFKTVIKVLSDLVRSNSIKDVFITKEPGFGADHSFEQREDGYVHTWDHFRVDLPQKFITKSSKSEASLMGELRDIRNVFKRSLDEISKDSIETVLDLISQNSLYKGEEWNAVLVKFLALHNEYHNLTEKEKDCYCWKKSIEIGGVIGKIKNHSIGVLLIDISSGVDLDDAVKRYENIVAPTNYKRPKAIFTKKMIEQAETTLSELGLLDSLGRRFATIEDITVNNILFANKDSLKQMGGVFDELKNEVAINQKSFSKVEEIPIEQFIKDILPRTTNIEVFLENKHSSNLVSIIAPQNKESKTLFKWNNGFSWAYNGNIADSMKERVKAAGGNIEGVLRFSIQWNTNGDNPNDYDAHCIEPNGNHIYYGNKLIKHPSTGMLDVDILHPKKEQIAVENITWTSLDKMREGSYHLFVNNFAHRGGTSGFSAEIEYDGQIYSFDYNKELKQNEEITVARISFNRKEGIKFIKSLDSSVSSKKIWSLDTNQFHPVSVCMFSPNYWDLQTGIGHRHYMFILKGCINDTLPNGFFNEFLKEGLMAHKRVFEALGSKMKVESSINQLSGLGFSTTKRNSLICRLEGHVKRVVKIVF